VVENVKEITFVGCTFSGNTAEFTGGGIEVRSALNMLGYNTTFVENTAGWGEAVSISQRAP